MTALAQLKRKVVGLAAVCRMISADDFHLSTAARQLDQRQGKIKWTIVLGPISESGHMQRKESEDV